MAQNDSFDYIEFVSDYQHWMDLYFAEDKIIKSFIPFNNFLM